MLTPLIRRMISGPTPFYMIESPTPGTGKGLLAESAAIIATGREPPVISEPHGEEEFRKRVTSKLLESPQILYFDNINRRLDSAVLSRALTATIWEDRILGFSRNVSVPVNTTWIGTANNPALSDELARRIVRIRIDAGMERPHERNGFKHERLKSYVKAQRPLILSALFTLVRAWIGEGRPKGDEVMGSFESWTEVVGGILKAVGIAGFLNDRDQTYALADSRALEWKAFIYAWHNSYRSQTVAMDKLFDLAKEHKLLVEVRSGRNEQGARVAMGQALANIRDRRYGDYSVRRLKELGPDGRAHQYRLEVAGSPAETRADSAHSD